MWCKIHHPPTVAKKTAERDARWQAEWDAKQARWKREAVERGQLAAALDACRKIADGHNDPRALAQAVMAMVKEPTK
jgi:hypothetical protein